MRSVWRIAALAAVLGMAPLAASAQQSYGDWAKQCEPAPDGRERCYLIQTVQADSKPIMVVIVAYSPERDRVAAMIDVPLGMDIPAGLKVRADNVEKDIAFEQCLPTGCRAMLPMDDAIISALKRGAKAAITGRDRDGASVELPISATGFDEAFGAL